MASREKEWNPVIWFPLSKWDQTWIKQESGDRAKCWRASAFKSVRENASGAHMPSQAGMKGTLQGEQGRDSWVLQGSSEPGEPHAGSNCYENPGSGSEANHVHGKLSLFWSSSHQRLLRGFLIKKIAVNDPMFLMIDSN